MASPSHDEGEAFATAHSGALTFDVSVFRTYLASLLPPGQCARWRDLLATHAQLVADGARADVHHSNGCYASGARARAL